MPCNQECIFCQRNEYLSEHPDIKPPSKEEVKKEIQKCKDDIINFTGGGEPTMCDDLFELICYAKNLGIKQICLETNGVKLEDRKYINKLKEYGMNHCIISLHSHNQTISDIITNAPGTFVKTIKALENLKLEKIQISILHTLCSLNYKDSITFVKFIRENFGNTIDFTIGFVWPKKNNEVYGSITPQFSHIKNDIHKFFKYLIENKIQFNISQTCNFPLCYIPLEIIPKLTEVKIYFSEGKEKFDLATYASEKIKPEQCKSCSLNCICTGIFKTYYEMYGGEELHPISASLEQIKKKKKKDVGE